MSSGGNGKLVWRRAGSGQPGGIFIVAYWFMKMSLTLTCANTAAIFLGLVDLSPNNSDKRELNPPRCYVDMTKALRWAQVPYNGAKLVLPVNLTSICFRVNQHFLVGQKHLGVTRIMGWLDGCRIAQVSGDGEKPLLHC